MRSKTLCRASALAAALALVLLVAACGGSSSSGAGETVAPTGAPYSFTMPSGFKEIPAVYPNGEPPPHLTLMVPEGTEGEGYLNAYEWSLGDTEKGFSTKRLLAFVDEETQSFYKGEGAGITAGEDETVAGSPAVCWRVKGFDNFKEGLVDAEACAIVPAPGLAVEQSCSWKPATKAAIEKGCEELRASLEFPTVAE
jgi:hypothetical protein